MKLQGKLLLFLAGSIIALALACGWAAYSQLQQSLKEEIQRQMNTLIDQITQLTRNRLATAKANVEIFANTALLGRYLLITDERQRYELLQAPIMQLLADYQKIYPDYYEIRVLLPDGYEDTRVTRAGLRNVTEEEGNTPYFEKLRTSGDAVSTTVFRNPDNGELALLVAKGIALAERDVAKVAAQPSIRGYLAITMSLSFLQDQVNNNRPGQTGYMFITDRRGQILFHPDETQRGQRVTPPFLHLLPADDNQHGPAAPAQEYQRMLMQAQDLFGDLRLFAVLPDTELATASRELALSVAGITTVAITLTTFWLFAILRSLVLNPVRELIQAVRELGSGRFPKQLPVSGHDEIGELAIAFNTMSENLRQSGERIHQLAYQDISTGLPNRRLFTQCLEYFLKEGQHFALLFLDLDEFKKVNDTLGHDAGDEYLREVAKRLSACVRSADEVMQMEIGAIGNTVARLGGDEFIVLLPDIHSTAAAIKVAERLLASISRPMVLRKWEFHISASIGITLFPDHGHDVDSLIRSADIAMYATKQQGKNGFRIYNEAMHALTRRRFDLENALRKALENDEFTLYYQPQIDLKSGCLAGVEALLRWPHPTRGMIPPDEFIPIAEQSGLITALGEWVLRDACRQAKQWQQERNQSFPVAVNISNLQLRTSAFAVKVKRILEETGLPPQNLELELTETIIMHASADTLDNLRQLRAAGIQIALDDFGTGYSSLGALHSLPIDKLKIDRSFVRDLEQNGDDAIIAAIIAMARRLHLTVVAEGVETVDQLAYLCAEDCDIAQGYLFSRPLPAAELITNGFPSEHLHALRKAVGT